MAQPFEIAIITEGGMSLLNKVQMGECKIEFTRMVVGSGIYDKIEKSEESLRKRIALKTFQNEYPISGKEIHDDYTVKLSALITNVDPISLKALVTTGYYINEMGIYARQKDIPNTEVLYSIAITTGEKGDFMPAYTGHNPAQITQEYYATVGNSAVVSIKINGAVALAGDVDLIKYNLEAMAGRLIDVSIPIDSYAEVFYEEADPNALSNSQISEALSQVWDGTSSTDSHALSSSQIEAAIETTWDGNGSDDPYALSSQQIDTILK